MRTVCLALLLVLPLAAEEASVDQKLDRVVAAVEQMRQESAAKDRRISTLEGQVENLTRLLQERGTTPGEAPASPAAGSSVEGEARRFADRKLAPTFGGIYTKPFLGRMGATTYLGGYMDFEFGVPQDENDHFEQERLIPFIYSEVSEQVRFATEIEFEEGGPDSPQGGGEVSVEFATMDFLMKDWANLRGGLVLSPLGKLNLVHDSPIQDLTDRPIVDRLIIPTTLTEAGIGFFGRIEPPSEESVWEVNYELYAVNGFEVLEDDGTVHVDREEGLRDARGSASEDVNNSPAAVGRLAWSPLLGLEFAGSFHVGLYDEDGENLLGIYALDAAWQSGPFELLFEGAYADFERDDFAEASGVPEDFIGFYMQANYHWMPECLRSCWPAVFRPDSTFTSVVRWDQVDLDGNRTERVTLGLNFRHTEQTVFKLDYQFNLEDFEHGEVDNDEFIFSFATYF